MSFEELEFIANVVRDEWTMRAIAPRLGPAVPILIREFEQDSYSVVLTRITGPSVLPVNQSTTQNLVAGIDQLLRERVQVLLEWRTRRADLGDTEEGSSPLGEGAWIARNDLPNPLWSK
ncbi:hypothetical protein CH300_27565 [Rhodococcus sp. 15-1154-1]|nr:hypothetical protein [Rhodococcus sp. 15-1154-1]OZE96738.1 hypothetical protein CH300_27565 [Rhodococcus sp. 15-1154-1]